MMRDLTVRSLARNYISDIAFLKDTALSLIKAHLQENLVYRFDLVVGLVKTFILVFVFRYLWIALYGGQEVFAGVTIKQTITYATLSMVIAPLFPNSLILEVGERMRSGDVLFDITRPLYYGNFLLFQMIGKSVAKLLTLSIPMFILTSLSMELTFPTNPVIWASFLLSFILGFLIAFFLDFIASLSGFWLTEIWGVFFAKWSVTDILGGTYLPLWIFPPILGPIVLLLPFCGITYIPLSILVGEVNIQQIPMRIGLQIIWLILLAFLSRFIYGIAVKKLAVQGG
jgi:ABC-2 type transport system permease protein